MTALELRRDPQEQQHNPQEQQQHEVHEQLLAIEVHRTQAQDHLRGLQLLDRVVGLQGLEVEELFEEEINPQ